jgi:hypothetical protein
MTSTQKSLEGEGASHVNNEIKCIPAKGSAKVLRQEYRNRARRPVWLKQREQEG